MKKAEQFFDQTNLKKDGYLTIEDCEQWIENIKKDVKPEPALIEKFLKHFREFWVETVGLKPGVKLTKEQYCDKMAEVSLKERTEFEKGNRDCQSNRYQSALFDLVDTNHNGFLELDEYEKLMKASYFEKDMAKIVFDLIDTNHDGKLSRQELIDHNIKFWFYPEAPKDLAGMYGSRFE